MKRYKKIIIVIAAIVVLFSATSLIIRKVRINPLTGKVNPKSYGPLCGEVIGQCNGLLEINCKAEVDGPLYYVNAKTGAIVAECGGACVARKCPLGTCPPKAWTCD